MVIGLLAATGYYWYFQKSLGKLIGAQIADGLLQPHPVREVDPEAWRSLERGMTQLEVTALLGEAPAKSKMDPNLDTDYTEEELDRLEYWS